MQWRTISLLRYCITLDALDSHARSPRLHGHREWRSMMRLSRCILRGKRIGCHCGADALANYLRRLQ
jgi:hypothetical protein